MCIRIKWNAIRFSDYTLTHGLKNRKKGKDYFE